MKEFEAIMLKTPKVYKFIPPKVCLKTLYIFVRKLSIEIGNDHLLDNIQCNPEHKTKILKQPKTKDIKLRQHFIKNPHLNEVKNHIPYKHFLIKKRLSLQHLYLADKYIAKDVALHMLPYLRQNKPQIVCETNAGLGLITAELLDNGITFVRLYEMCNEFRQILKDFSDIYPGRIELFVKDLYHLSSMSHLDKFDNGNRVIQLLKDVPKRDWSDDPVLTVVGPMPRVNLINYLIKLLTLQEELITYGRVQIFALMRPMDYFKYTATPKMNLHTYQTASILFQLFFECNLLEKYPRTSFVPWETKKKITTRTHSRTIIDADFIYFVRIHLKPTFPTDKQHLLHLYYFIKEGFLRGKRTIIPIVERWLPGIGETLITPGRNIQDKSFPNMSIYTQFRELNPQQILQIFLCMLKHPEYKTSPFVDLVESQLLKNETIETDLADFNQPAHNVNVDNMQEFF